MPFWDNCGAARSAIPGIDGSACMFRLDGAFMSSGNPMSTMKAVNRTVREVKTAELLQRPGGQWKNGWYEDLSGSKWYSDVISSNQQSEFNILKRQFNVLTVWMTSVFIANGERYGFFLYEGAFQMQSKSTHDWETLLSNAATVQVLLCLMAAMVVLQRGYFLGISDWQNIGLSCLVNLYQFTILPVMLLPRMKMSLVAFWSSGCRFEGQQKAFSDEWDLIYPSIVEVLLCYYSALDTLGQLLHLRISDKCFGVFVMLLCLVQWSRKMVAFLGWLGIDGRISTAFYADELQEMTLVQLLTTSVALRINENVKSVFFIKVAILAANLVPVVVFGAMNIVLKGAAFAQTSRIEAILAVHVRNSGGLGHLSSRKNAISPAKPVQGDNASALSQYELTRLGYFVYGNTSTDAEVFLITLDAWILLTQLAPLRRFTNLWNHRAKVFPIVLHPDEGAGSIANEPEICRVNDPRLQGIRWWHFHAQPIA